MHVNVGRCDTTLSMAKRLSNTAQGIRKVRLPLRVLLDADDAGIMVE